MSEYTTQGISVTSQCYDCITLDDMCLNCTEGKEARDSAVAHQLVDEGNMQYKRNWLRNDDQWSASDWVASETADRKSKYIITIETIKVDKGTYIDSEGETREYNENWYHMEERVVVTKRETDWLIRSEFTKPTVTLQDGGVYEELWELDDERQYAREVQCPWCFILTPKLFNDCQSCDGILEHNVGMSALRDIEMEMIDELLKSE
jgi:hypothetical protein